MEIVVEKLLAAVRPLLSIRPALWALLIASSGFGLGLALHSDLAARTLDILLFAWVLVIGLAALNVSAAERRAERRRQQKLDRLYGRGR
ncbi:MAG TPA: hypothetical protein VKV32_13110 [Stellaceae bacterium]|nr:hypothetical protein [Stellaceae bacterium]